MASQFQTFPVKMCTDEDLERLRHHVLRFHSKSVVDPATFVQPARLHRKDPKNLQFQLSLKEMVEQKKRKKEEEIARVARRVKYRNAHGIGAEKTDNEVDELIAVEGMNEEDKKAWLEEKKKQDQIDMKNEQREKDLMKVAPDGEGKNGSAVAKSRIKQRKTKQVKVYNEVKRKLRYEEFYPWVLEDYDAQQAWVGNFEANETESYCMLILDEKDRCFKMVPIDKFYKFTPRNKYATLTLEEAEAKMADKARVSRWLMSKMEKEVEDGMRIDSRYRKKAVSVMHDPLFDEEDNRNEDEDGMDYEDEFQDDEEAPIMEGPDEDKKLVESKMRQNMLKASNLIEKSDDEDDDFDDLFESKPTDKESKKLKKALSKNAINEVYASDDEDENPYLSAEEDEDEEEEEIKKEPETDVKVKMEEEDEEELLKSETSSKKPKQKRKSDSKIYVLSVNQGFVTFKAKSEVLKAFPRGEWNSKTAIKRELSPDAPQPSPKKVKLEPTGEQPLTSRDIDILLEDGPLDLSQVVHLLKRKVASGNNRALLKKFLKEDFVVRNKKLYRKNQI